MSKELEALKLIKWKLEDEGILGKEYELCDIIEKALKRLEELENAFDSLSKDDEKAKKLLSKEIEKNRAFEIIKKHPMFSLHDDLPKGTYRMYDCELYSHYDLTKEEYDLLKEVLL